MPARSQPIPTDRLRKYLEHGMTARAIAERTGRSDVAVYAAIKAAGLTLNRVTGRKTRDVAAGEAEYMNTSRQSH